MLVDFRLNLPQKVFGVSELLIQDGHFTWRPANEGEEGGQKGEQQREDNAGNVSAAATGRLSNVNLRVEQVSEVLTVHSSVFRLTR